MGHIPSSLCKHQPSDNQILPRGLAEQMGRKHQQRIEPSSSLINTFGDKISWEGVLEQFFVLKRVVSLSIGHTARLEPAVEDLFDAFQIALAFF
jgi:hypothetical protein